MGLITRVGSRNGASSERRLYGEVDPRWRRRFGVVARAAAWAVVLGGVLAMVGRALEIPELAQWVPRLRVRPMQPASALLFALSGLSVLGLAAARTRLRYLSVVGGILVVLGGVTVIVANLLDLSFPRWLVPSYAAEDVLAGEQIARPALNEGTVLAAAGLGIAFLAARSRLLHVMGQLLAAGAAMVGATVIVAFAYGDDNLRGFPLGSGRMAISAALLTILLCGAVVIARPALGIMAPIISPWPGGIVLRRFLPFVLAGPPLAIALLLASTTPESQPRWFALAAVLVSGLLMAALFATAAAVSGSARDLAVAEDLVDRAEAAVIREAGIVEVLLARLSQAATHVDGLDVAVRFRPAQGWLAGDSVLTIPLGESRLAAILIDVVGHGPHPAVAAARLGDAIQHALRNGAGPAHSIAQAWWVLDQPQLMASVTVVEIDARTGALLYALAGSPPVVHWNGRDVECYQPTGPVMLADETGSWDQGVTVLSPGDVLLIYSDGLADPTQPRGKTVATLDDLVDAVRRCPYRDAERLAEWCIQESVGQAGGVVADDASLIVISRPKTEPPGEEPAPSI
ncbi:MAG: PP2C family protein-serine/threonine phosphatase [Actinomycetota bacterium]